MQGTAEKRVCVHIKHKDMNVSRKGWRWRGRRLHLSLGL